MIGPDEYKCKIECSAPIIRRALADLVSSHYFSYVKIIITNEYLLSVFNTIKIWEGVFVNKVQLYFF